MILRRAAVWLTLSSTMATLCLACWGEAAEHPDHHRHHWKTPIRPAPPPEPPEGPRHRSSHEPGAKARYGADAKDGSRALAGKNHEHEMKQGLGWLESWGTAGRAEERRLPRVAHPGYHSKGDPGKGATGRLLHHQEHRDRSRPSTHHQTRPASLPNRPNILVLLLDDQDDYTPYWEAMPRTAAIMSKGLRFSRMFSPTPICTPGRCTFLTGRLAHNTGVYTIAGSHGAAAFVGQPSTEFSVGLSQLGYMNGYFGKTWGGTEPNPGWQRWCAVSGNNMYTGYGYDVTDHAPGGRVAHYTSGEYVTDFISQRAYSFLRKGVPAGQPFFVCLAPTAPHLPLPPARRHVAYARRRWKDNLPTHGNFNERDVSDKSAWLRSQASIRSACVPYAPHEYHKRMGSLMSVDEMMGRIQNLLIQQGKWNNTIVFVTSDNGYNLGAHRLIHKQAPYEESIRVPLYVAGPGVAAGEIHRLVGLHDLAPTFLQLAGGQAPSSMDGKPLGAFLASGSDSADPDWRNVLLTEYDAGGVHPGFNPGGAMKVGWELDIPTYRSIRTETLKYIVWLGTGEEEVYDLVNDPDELNNLTRVDPSGARPLLDQLRPMLVAVKGCAGGGCP